MEQNQNALHPTQVQHWKLTKIDSEKKASYQMQGMTSVIWAGLRDWSSCHIPEAWTALEPENGLP